MQIKTLIVFSLFILSLSSPVFSSENSQLEVNRFNELEEGVAPYEIIFSKINLRTYNRNRRSNRNLLDINNDFDAIDQSFSLNNAGAAYELLFQDNELELPIKDLFAATGNRLKVKFDNLLINTSVLENQAESIDFSSVNVRIKRLANVYRLRFKSKIINLNCSEVAPLINCEANKEIPMRLMGTILVKSNNFFSPVNNLNNSG
ncbi:MAG: hypothetical protein HRT47_11830 [Candidatus Caenarcaniphilales bacterium]|nr:hypothetical protein [Candidatus Caenarcaniphilales bacterium]